MEPWNRPPQRPGGGRRPPYQRHQQQEYHRQHQQNRQRGDTRYPQASYGTHGRPIHPPMPPPGLFSSHRPPPPFPAPHLPAAPPFTNTMPRMSNTTTVRPSPPDTAEGEVDRLPADERMVFEKMVETYHRNPELVDMVKQSQRGNPKYAFLFEGSRLHRCFQHRTGQRPPSAGRMEEESAGSTTHRASAAPFFRPPPPVPPPEALASMRSADPANYGASDPAVHLPRYHSLPAGLMVALVNEDHAAPYSALRASVLESTGFLDSVAPNLLSYLPGTADPAATAKPPREEREKVPDSMEQALAHFERGLCYIYKEGEFRDRDNPFASRDSQHVAGSQHPPPAIMDKDGWEPGALERVLWDRRRGSAQRRRWRRIRDRERRRAAGEDVSSSSESSASGDSKEEEDGSTSSSSGSDSDSSSGSSSASSARSGHPARQRANPRRSANSTGGSSSVNRAIGSDNVGFKMLARLGWQQGQGLGASNDGIVEPIRPQTRFSTVRNTKGSTQGGRYHHQQQQRRGRRRGAGSKRGAPVERASLGTGRLGHDADKPAPTDSSLADAAADNKAGDEFETYRMQMSSAYTKHQP
ncbi:hypothetical protein LPJ72_005575 [Coemansia sp. Benny D160-2]|nr:hypothetical protein LPJ72_005575 [Coemansia sp. Benny D160-2]